MRDRIFCVPITVISSVGAVFATAVTATQLALQFLTLSMFSVIVTGPLLLADVIVAILLFIAIRWRRPRLVLPILIVTMVNVIAMSIQFVLAVWALSSNDSPLAQAIMDRLSLYYPWMYGWDEDWKIENTQLEIHGIAQGLTIEFTILIPLSFLFLYAHIRTYRVVRVRRRMRHSGLARTARVIPPAYAYPTPLASPHDDTKPPSYSLVVEKPPVIFDPTGGDKEKVKY
ncbi:hypothetical protein PRIPAC_81483 [Pristionchus pacificus]|uniref:Uncharacterized protein n=1 Tax=Pristionchus pacificus TaxID=54126 RepID=A0A2A6CKC4_PRIPA|nr:hypothetical protein PRIPAC_81483 [Pristionchus pacificus]|eukprot:PDM78538.1 hypothetical protein PRIPAC_31117 [Pristionchus pacificus]